MVTPQNPRKCSGIWGQPAAVSLQKPLPSCTSPSLLPSSCRSLWKFPKPTSNGQVNSSASLSKVATKVLFSSLDQWSSPVGNVPPFIKVMTCLFCLNYTFLTGSRSLTPRRNVCVQRGGLGPCLCMSGSSWPSWVRPDRFSWRSTGECWQARPHRCVP